VSKTNVGGLPHGSHIVTFSDTDKDKRIAELEKRLVAPTDSGIDELDYICKVFNNNEQDNLTSLVSLIWNKSRFEALKEQVK
jgi:hypothetical protein